MSEVVPTARHCQLAEIAAMVSFYGRIRLANSHITLSFDTEHEYLVEKYNKLIKLAFDMDGEKLEDESALRVLSALKIWQESAGKFADVRPVNPLLLQKTCCKRAFIRGCFLAAGSMSNPNKAYHLEIVCQDEMQAEQLKDILNDFELDAKVIVRKKSHVVYFKEGEHIVDLLNIMGAHKGLMDLENVRIMKEMRNSLNRQVNCETANIGKTVNAAVRQIAAINYIQKHGEINNLPEQLRQMAEVRIDNPDTPLKDLGALLDPPIGKSGVNHRLRKLVEIAEEMGMDEKKGK